MFSATKLGAILALAAPLSSALTITSLSGNMVIGSTVTVTWTTSPSDSATSFSMELLHPSFNNQLAVGLPNIVASTLSTTFEIPVVPVGDGYFLEFIAINDINTVFTITNSFAIGAENTTTSETVHASTIHTTSQIPISTPSAVSFSRTISTTPSSSTPTTPASANTNSQAASGGASSASASASGKPSSAALPARSVLGGSLPGAALVAVGLVAGAFAL